MSELPVLIIQSCDGGFRGDWDDGNAFEGGWDIFLQGAVKHPGEDWSQLVHTGLQTEVWQSIWALCLLGFLSYGWYTLCNFSSFIKLLNDIL